MATSDVRSFESALRAVLPDDVTVASAPICPTWTGELYDEEITAVALAGAGRRDEFSTGRHCARQALLDLGVPAVAICRGRRGEPLWPTGYIGSISHAAGVCVAVAAVARRGLTGIGIDLERARTLEQGLWPTVLTQEEQSMCRQSTDPALAASFIFSSKEAMFKAQYPIAGLELEFLDVEIDRVPTGVDLAAIRVLDDATPAGPLNRDAIGEVRTCFVGDLVVAVAVIC